MVINLPLFLEVTFVLYTLLFLEELFSFSRGYLQEVLRCVFAIGMLGYRSTACIDDGQLLVVGDASAQVTLVDCSYVSGDLWDHLPDWHVPYLLNMMQTSYKMGLF